MILNTNLKAQNATTQYMGIDINSMVNAYDSYFIANQTGLYLMDNDSSELVGSYFVTATMDFGIGNDKRLRYLYLSLESTDDLQVSISTEKVSAVSYPIEITIPGQQDIRIPITRNLHGRFWTFKISNGSSGADFSIDSIQVLPIIRSRAH